MTRCGEDKIQWKVKSNDRKETADDADARGYGRIDGPEPSFLSVSIRENRDFFTIWKALKGTWLRFGGGSAENVVLTLLREEQFDDPLDSMIKRHGMVP